MADAAPADSASPGISGLVAAARRILGEFTLGDFTAGGVGAAIRSRSGRIYTGICADFACGLGFCAEAAAVAEMLKNRESEIDALVAIGAEGILAPCGRCRELLAQVDVRNLDSVVVLGEGRTAALRDLLPERWLDPAGRGDRP